MMTRKQRHEKRAKEYLNRKGIKSTRPITIDELRQIQKMKVPSDKPDQKGNYFKQGEHTGDISHRTFPKMDTGAWSAHFQRRRKPTSRCIIGHDEKGNPIIGSQFVYRPGIRVKVNILSRMTCHVVTREDQKIVTNFGLADQGNYSVDHVVSRKKLFYAYLEGIIEKDQINDIEHLLNMRHDENAKKGDTSYMEKIIKRKNTDPNKGRTIQQEMKFLNETLQDLEIWSGCSKVSIDRLDENGVPMKGRKAKTIVQGARDPEFQQILDLEDLGLETQIRLAYWYKVHELLETPFYLSQQDDNDPRIDLEKENIRALGWTAAMVMKYHT